jgi:opacity protein-like surface antigen
VPLAGGLACAADMAFVAAGGASTHDWSGFYFGGTAGEAWGSLGLKTSTPFTGAYFPDTATLGAVNATGAQTLKPHGIPVGLEAGYNWQAAASPWVVGIEADIQSLPARSRQP